ncbi:hypothetical protein M9980_11615 [Sphingomonas donggukensis]|uniref:DUF2306 domain-containing protein n=1 Tax=Sphingomonas donggukensis TaxID=2949093 RepID=A0ABY4TS04_9SPHN|nr:hypothetical protein [Sphingomonas donggukensis]URW75188.1 hypothetical protein M9980_11615 [Sphingomonas donggukensis]
MATIAPERARERPQSLAPDRYEQVLSAGAVLLLGCVLVALARGQAEWSRVPWVVWPHLLTIIVALALTPVMLLRQRGDGTHRALGTVWVVAMLATAALSFLIRESRHGQLGYIHILSAWVLIQVPMLWWQARTHQVARHRRSVRAMVTGALLVAGFFTFPFNRLLGHWLFG